MRWLWKRTGKQKAWAQALLLGLAWAAGGAQAYDPLAAQQAVRVVDLTAVDAARQREIPLRVYLPASAEAAPVILFSHGLGGSRAGYAYLGKHWAAHGYVGVFLQHPGSDAEVWQSQPPLRRLLALKQAANGRNFLARVRDIPAVLDALERWQHEAGNPLAGRLDLRRVGMAGHSFGAVTTQAVGGQSFAGRPLFAEARISAALAMSPSPPQRGDAKAAFAGVRIPWLLMTGTRDRSPINDVDAASRLAVYPALPPGGKCELVLADAEHSAFGDRPLAGENGAAPEAYHRRVLAISTAFWDAYLRHDAAARQWLSGGAGDILADGDRWRCQ